MGGTSNRTSGPAGFGGGGGGGGGGGRLNDGYNGGDGRVIIAFDSDGSVSTSQFGPINPVPEPTSLAVLIAALFGFGILWRRARPPTSPSASASRDQVAR